MASLNEKIREIISFYKLSDRQFAMKIGVTQSVIGSMFQKGTEPSSKVIRNTLIAFPEISAEWFIRDTGNILKADQVNDITELAAVIAEQQRSLKAQRESIDALTKRILELEGNGESEK